MSLPHQGMSSRIAPTASVAPNAVVCGEPYGPRCLL